MSYQVMPYAVDLAQLRALAVERPIETERTLHELCATLGRRLPNEYWSAMRTDRFEAVDTAIGVSLIQSIFFAGSPVALVTPNDDYTVGHIEPHAIPELAHDLLDALDRNANLDPRIELAVDEVLDWLAAAEADGGLVTFYY